MLHLEDTVAWLRGIPSFARGIHPPARKALSSAAPIEVLPTPDTVVIPLQQHAGAPAQATCKPRSDVHLGDLIGENPKAFITARIHASIDGKVQPLTGVTLPNGRHAFAVPIKRDEDESKQTAWGAALFERLFGGSWDVEDRLQRSFPREIVDAVRSAGIVGLGGAAFPTHVKLVRQAIKPIHSVLLNGCECEPYLTSDHRLMVECPEPIVAGLRLAVKATGADHGVIAVEDNKPEAIEALRSVVDRLSSDANVSVVVVQTKYPMGGERQLIPTVFHKAVPTGGFPLDVGIAVINVGTAAAIAAAVLRGHPMTHRVISITGRGIRQPKNLLAPVGTPIQTLIDYCGGFTADARRVLAGGPMMGFTMTDMSVPLTKGSSGITVLSRDEVLNGEPTTCIRCGKCLDVCPLGLAPTKIAHAAKFEDYELAKRYDLTACCDCGCCAYVCPAHIPLVQYIRTGKMALMRQKNRT